MKDRSIFEFSSVIVTFTIAAVTASLCITAIVFVRNEMTSILNELEMGIADFDVSLFPQRSIRL